MRRKILLVEGENELRQRYQVELKASGYKVIAADSGEHALQKLQTESVDAIVMDVVLPDGAGFDYLKKIVASRRDVKVVIYTNHLYLKTDFNCWLADAFLAKSGDPTQLQTVLHDILEPN